MTCWLCGFETTKLSTNAEAPTCKNGSCQTCIAVARVDDEINQTVAALRHLLSKRLDLRSEQNRGHDPMHRLPLEIRHYTLELLRPRQDEWGNIQNPGKPSRVMPLYLTSICKSWRDIAWSNPSLWSTIRIVLRGHHSSRWIKFLHDWIQRSRTLPLTLSIVDHGWPFRS